MNTIEIGGITLTRQLINGVVEYRWNGTRIYRLTAEGFPGHITNTYLILDNQATLVDVAFDRKKSRADLEHGMEIIRRDFGQDIGLSDVSSIIVTHGHCDHFGMLANPALRHKKVYVHEADSAMLKDFKAQGVWVRERLGKFLQRAGREFNTDDLFYFDKLVIPIDEYDVVKIRSEQTIINSYEVVHVPGHSPGHICLGVGPILLLGDHILSYTTPHQFPKSLRPGCGVRLYLSSLEKVAGMGEYYGLPGHEEDIPSIHGRVEALEEFHYHRLLDILELSGKPKNLYQITDEYYRLRPETIKGKTVGQLDREDQILALEEIMSHIEYLIEDGRMKMEGTANGVDKYCRS